MRRPPRVSVLGALALARTGEPGVAGSPVAPSGRSRFSILEVTMDFDAGPWLWLWLLLVPVLYAVWDLMATGREQGHFRPARGDERAAVGAPAPAHR
jgi:hypothetical protein